MAAITHKKAPPGQPLGGAIFKCLSVLEAQRLQAQMAGMKLKLLVDK